MIDSKIVVKVNDDVDPYLPGDAYVLVEHSDILDLTECDQRKEFSGIFLGTLDEITNNISLP